MFLVAVLVAAVTSTAAAQVSRETGAVLRVTVLDQTDAALIVAHVSIVDARGAERTVAVDPRGVALFDGLAPGVYQVKATAEGFRTMMAPVTVRRGENRTTVRLVVATTEQAVVVEGESAAERRDNGFTQRLTQEDIDALPDDPDEMADALARMAGPNAHVFVNGFRNGRLPPKNQIQQIRFYANSFSAEYHDVGMIRVDIITKPGSAGWSGQANVGFRDESLNARNAFAAEKGPEQLRRYLVTFSGPIAKGRTGLSLSFDGSDAYESRTIVAQAPAGPVNALAVAPSNALNFSARVEHRMGEGGQLLAEYARRQNDRRNLGVGEFDLPERAYAVDTDADTFRVRAINVIGRRGFSELRFQISRSTNEISSVSTRPTIRVNDAFTDGGAGQFGDRRAREIELGQNIDFTVGRRHSMRAGVLLEAGWWNSTQRANAFGTYTFTSLDAYRAGTPATYSIRTGDPVVDYSQVKFGWYVQDDVRLTRRLQLSVGMRQEGQTQVDSTWKLAPRAAFTWRALKTVTIRGGYGIFHDWYDADLYEQTVRVDGVRQLDIVVQSPSFPVTETSGTRLPPSVIRSSSLDQSIVHQVSIGVERALTSWAEVRTDYLWNRGFDTLRSINVNAPINGVRPDPSVGNITEIQSSGKRTSDRWAVALTMREPTRRIIGMVTYQLGTQRNYADRPLSLPADSTDPDLDWGPAAQDVRHRFFFNVNAPVGRGLRVSLSGQRLSATPYSVTTGFDPNGDTVFNERPPGVTRNSARGTAQWIVNLRTNKSIELGGPRVGASLQRGPGGAGGDASPMGATNAGKYRLDLYVSVQNLLNYVNYDGFVGNLQSTFFGQPTSAGPARRVEIGASLGF